MEKGSLLRVILFSSESEKAVLAPASEFRGTLPKVPRYFRPGRDCRFLTVSQINDATP
jgi:hypothetical protein